MGPSMFRRGRFAVGSACMLAMTISSAAQAAVVYVDDDALAGGDGTSWATAFNDLQLALGIAQESDEIRVAQGIYKPAPPNGPRTATFNLVNATILRGGYAGIGANDPDENDPVKFETILSGDLNGDDGSAGTFVNYSDNALHVLAIAGQVDGTMHLEGLIIESGSADGDPAQLANVTGGALVSLNQTKCTLHACIFKYNQAEMGGGAVYCEGEVHMTACTFEGNRGINPGAPGGAVVFYGGAVNGCVFENNRAGVVVAAGSGGAVASIGPVTVIDSIFRNNAGGTGTALNFDGIGTVTGTLFHNNSGDEGAIYVRVDSHLTAIDCQFIGNGAGVIGGAISIRAGGAAEVLDSHFDQNLSSTGGAIANRGSLLIVNSKLIGNALVGVHPTGGGALYNDGGCTVLHCDFSGNASTNDGGAIHNHTNGTLTVANSILTDNRTSLIGQASYFGGGLLNRGAASVINSTLVGNIAKTAGGGVANAGALHIKNSILWDNLTLDQVATLEQEQIVANPAADLFRCLVQGWTGTLGGTGNHGNDPRFIDADGPDNIYGTEDDNPRLLPNSPLIDHGDNSELPPDTFDLDEDGDTTEPIPLDLDWLPRIVGEAVDVGAYEFQGTPCLADITGDSAVNVQDMLSVINAWGSCVSGQPCNADVTLDNAVNTSDLLWIIDHWGACLQ